jgi:enamine deaminase RidA (YjgF/YER057c/UK114 family)
MKASATFLFLIAVLVPAALGQGKIKNPRTEKQFINPDGLVKSPSYSHAVSVTGGRMIFISGQVSLNEKGELVGGNDLGAQTRRVFENMKVVLAAAGATFSDVVKLTYYVKNYNPEKVTAIREARSQYFPKDKPPPASTLVGVETLFRDDVLIEIEAIAVVQ